MKPVDIAQRRASLCPLSRVAVIPVRIEDGCALIALAASDDGRVHLFEETSTLEADPLEAARTAMARGGLGGTVDPLPIGAYLGWAGADGDGEPCFVNLFVLRADGARADEAVCRWLPLEAAMDRLGDERLSPLLQMAAALVGVEGKAAA